MSESLSKVFFFKWCTLHRSTKIFHTDKTVFSYFVIFLHRSRFSRPFWSLPKTLSALTFFRAVSLSPCPSSHENRETGITRKCMSFSFSPVSFLCHAHHPQFSSLFFMIANASRMEVASRRKRACLVCLRGSCGGARGLWTVEFVSHCCWGGLKTCCNMAAGQTASGSQSGKPGKTQKTN